MAKTPPAAAPKQMQPTPDQLARLARARQVVRQFVPEDVSLVDELLKERRAAAADE